jgi:hypothetical protein
VLLLRGCVAASEIFCAFEHKMLCTSTN